MPSLGRRLSHALGAALLAVAVSHGASAKTSPGNKPKASVKAPPKRAETAASPRPKAPPLASLGSISVGRPDAGVLVNGVPMPRSPDWVVTSPQHAYGTEETVEQLGRCIRKVRASYADSPPVMLGSLSKLNGGYVPPHKSHRSGRDADVYFFRKPGAKWYEAATRSDIDLPRTWALLRCFVSEADVDLVLIDRRVQEWLEEYALRRGEPRAWLWSLFHDGPGPERAVVRDAPGHVAHMHVRFVSARSRQRAITHYDRLVAEGRIKGASQSVKHKVRPGETLGTLAKKYKTSVRELLRLNALGSTRIRVGQELEVSRKSTPLRGVKDPIRVPPRRVPPRAALDDASGERAARAEVDTSGSDLWQRSLPF
jgi:penicillin-insensitive murein endopeptidase